MVIGTILLVAAAPGLLGTQEAIRQSQQKEKREEHRARRCGLIATCVKSSIRGREVDSRQIVLVNNRLYVDTGTADDNSFGHPFAGYYLPYPDEAYEGMVTTITDVAPILNWVYIDRETYQVKHGIRANAQPNLHGPFDCTRQDRRLTFEGWEGFVAVEEEPYLWAIYFDCNDNGLKGKVPPGTRVLEIELTRREKKWKKDPVARKEEQGTAQTASESTTLHATPQNGVDQNGEKRTGNTTTEQLTPSLTPSRPAKTAAENQAASRSRNNPPATPPQESPTLNIAIPTRPKRVDSMSPDPESITIPQQSSSRVNITAQDEDNISATTEESNWSGSSNLDIQESQVDYTPTTSPDSSPRKSEIPDSSPGKLETIKEERLAKQSLSEEALNRFQRSQSTRISKQSVPQLRRASSPCPRPQIELPKTTTPKKSRPRPQPRSIKTPLYDSLRTEPNSPYSSLLHPQNNWRQSQHTIRGLASRTTVNLNLETTKLNALEHMFLKMKRFHITQLKGYYRRAKSTMGKKLKPRRRASNVEIRRI